MRFLLLSLFMSIWCLKSEAKFSFIDVVSKSSQYERSIWMSSGVKELLTIGSIKGDIDEERCDGKTALMIAVENNDRKAIRWLMGFRPYIDKQSLAYVLKLAIEDDNIKSVKWALKFNPSKRLCRQVFADREVGSSVYYRDIYNLLFEKKIITLDTVNEYESELARLSWRVYGTLAKKIVRTPSPVDRSRSSSPVVADRSQTSSPVSVAFPFSSRRIHPGVDDDR